MAPIFTCLVVQPKKTSRVASAEAVSAQLPTGAVGNMKRFCILTSAACAFCNALSRALSGYGPSLATVQRPAEETYR